MKNIIRKISVVVLAVLLGLTVVGTKQAFADENVGTSISISPVSKILQLSASSVYEDTFKISNNGS